MNQKGLAPILIVIILAVAFVGGYLVYQKQIKPTSQPAQTIQPLPPDANPAPNGAGETTNWKVYTDSNVGISLRYPNDWKLNPAPSFGKNRRINLSPQNGTDSSIIALEMVDNPKKLSVEEQNAEILKELSHPTEFGQSPIPILSSDSKKVSTSNGINAYYNHEANCVLQCREYVWARADKFYYLYYFYPKLPNQEQIFDQILSTFKFLP